MLRVFVILFSMFVISGCSDKTKKFLGVASSGPNEYAVGKNKPLEVPPHFNLTDIDEQQSKTSTKTEDHSADMNPGEEALVQSLSH